MRSFQELKSVDAVRVFLANGQSMHFPVDRRLGSACLEPTNFECTSPSTNPCWSVDFPRCVATHSWKDCFALPFQKIFFFCVERGQCRRHHHHHHHHHHHLYHLDHPRRHGRPCHRRRRAGRCCRRVGHVVVVAVVDKRRECSWNLNTFPSRSSVALTNGPFFCKAKRFCNCFWRSLRLPVAFFFFFDLVTLFFVVVSSRHASPPSVAITFPVFGALPGPSWQW